jgi:hypothetical protein
MNAIAQAGDHGNALLTPSSSERTRRHLGEAWPYVPSFRFEATSGCFWANSTAVWPRAMESRARAGKSLSYTW